MFPEGIKHLHPLLDIKALPGQWWVGVMTSDHLMLPSTEAPGGKFHRKVPIAQKWAVSTAGLVILLALSSMLMDTWFIPRTALWLWPILAQGLLSSGILIVGLFWLPWLSPEQAWDNTLDPRPLRTNDSTFVPPCRPYSQFLSDPQQLTVHNSRTNFTYALVRKVASHTGVPLASWPRTWR